MLPTTMPTIAPLLLALLLAPAQEASRSPGPLAVDAAPSVCPAENARARAITHRFLTSPAFAQFRTAHGMGGVDPASLRLLTDAVDGPACQKLRDMIGITPARYPRVLTYYSAGGFYFAATTWVLPPDRMWISHAPLLVFDGQLNYLDAYAM